MHGREYFSVFFFKQVFIAYKKNKIIFQTVCISNVSWHILRVHIFTVVDFKEPTAQLIQKSTHTFRKNVIYVHKNQQ